VSIEKGLYYVWAAFACLVASIIPLIISSVPFHHPITVVPDPLLLLSALDDDDDY